MESFFKKECVKRSNDQEMNYKSDILEPTEVNDEVLEGHDSSQVCSDSSSESEGSSNEGEPTYKQDDKIQWNPWQEGVEYESNLYNDWIKDKMDVEDTNGHSQNIPDDLMINPEPSKVVSLFIDNII